MALDDLKATIETLRKRIYAHRAYLEGHETRTRQGLIDPMLRALGWDVEDPNSVQVEYKDKSRKNQMWLDYTLMSDGTPIVVIETKVLGTPLDNARVQAHAYSNKFGIGYMVATNGDHWQMFGVSNNSKLGESILRILMNFQLTQNEPYACALQVLGLWRPNLASGEPKEAATPVTIKPSPEDSVSTTPEPANDGDWERLTSLKVKSRQKAPASIRFSNSSPKPIKNWTDLLVSVAEHLVETGKISAGDCPVPVIKGNRNLLHTDPTHPTGSEFHSKRKIGELWLNTHFPSPDSYEHSRWLIEQFGDPSTVLVSTNPS